MTIPLLAPLRAQIVLAEGIAFARGRVHEICGPSRRFLALALAGATGHGAGNTMGGEVIWAHPSWEPAQLNPQGMRPFLDPSRLILAGCRRPVDQLWTLEESLRSGAVTAAVADLPDPPGLTPLRRLHLAAEAGGGRGTGIVMTPGEGGAPGVESRWHAAPDPEGGWRLQRLRARMAPVAGFRLWLTPRGQFACVPQAA